MDNLPHSVRHFDDLPDSARIDSRSVEFLLGISRPTRIRWEHKGLLPKSERASGGKASFVVGELRSSRAFKRPEAA